MTAHGHARERWNEIRRAEQAEQRPGQGVVSPARVQTTSPQPAGPEGSPSVIVGAPGWQEQLEKWGMISAFGEDDEWTRRIRGY
jgi:hypothetical protein